MKLDQKYILLEMQADLTDLMENILSILFNLMLILGNRFFSGLIFKSVYHGL